MTDSRMAYDPDRLPWLTEERKPRRKPGSAPLLLWALLAALLVAGASYWLGMQSATQSDDFADTVRDLAPAATVKLPAAGGRRASTERGAAGADARSAAGGGARSGPDCAGDSRRAKPRRGRAVAHRPGRRRGRYRTWLAFGRPRRSAVAVAAPGADAGLAGVGIAGRLRARGADRRVRQPAPGEARLVEDRPPISRHAALESGGRAGPVAATAKSITACSSGPPRRRIPKCCASACG